MLILLWLDGAQPFAARCPSSRISNVITVRDKGMVLSNLLPQNMAIDHFKGQQHHNWHRQEANTGFRVMSRPALRYPFASRAILQKNSPRVHFCFLVCFIFATRSMRNLRRFLVLLLKSIFSISAPRVTIPV
jgi:hypothetical protein